MGKTKSKIRTGSCRISALSPGSSSVAVYDTPGQQTHASFLLAHEGLSFPQVEGRLGNQTFSWTSDGLKSLGEAIEPNIPIYRGHKSRREIGSVIGSYLEKNNNGLRSVIVGRFPGGIDQDVDTCSLEADIEYDLSDNSVLEVLDVTGIAVESSRRSTPGFPGARIMGKATFLQPQGGNGMDEGFKNGSPGGVSVEDIRRVFQKLEDLEGTISDQINKKILEVSEKQNTAQKEGKADNDDTKERLAKLEQLQLWPARFEKLLPKDLTQSQEQFLRRRINQEDYAAKSDEEAQVSVNRVLRDEYPEYAKIFTGSGQLVSAPPEEGSQESGEESIVERAYKLLMS